MDLKYISSNDNIIEGVAIENSSVIVKKDRIMGWKEDRG